MKTSRRVGLGASVLVLWTVVGLWVAPAVIRQAYNHQSLEILNGIISGRDAHPVGFYLDAWRTVFAWCTALVALFGAALLFPQLRRKIISWVIGGAPELPTRAVMWYAIWICTLGGAAETLFEVVRQVVVHSPDSAAREFLWMAPLSSALAGLLVGTAMVAVAFFGRARWHVGKATLLLSTGAAYALLQPSTTRLHVASAALLSVGIATALARTAVPRAGGLVRTLRAGRPYLAGLVLAALAYGWFTSPEQVEGRALRGRAAAEAGAPNILLIILDTVRAANLSLYGYGRPTTPRLADWAKSGVVFERAISTAPWTLPSHASVFTGEFNHVARTGFRRSLDDALPTLAEVLDEHGYATAGFTGNLMYTTKWSGLDRGFDRWVDYEPSLGLFLDSSWLSQLVTRRIAFLAGMDRYFFSKNAQVVSERFLEWIGPEQDRPFFAFVNLFDAHSPYGVPAAFAGTFGPLPTQSYSEFFDGWRSDPDKAYSPQDAKLWVNMYDDAVAYIDHQLGMLHDELAARGVLDNTIVVVTGDHGELLGEHGLLNHAAAVYDPLLHVPLFISFPPTVPAGQRIDEGISLRDLPATILDLAGLGRAPFPGTSLSPLWADGKATLVHSPLLSEVELQGTTVPDWTPLARGDLKSLYLDRFHYIRGGDGTEELYDLSTDPAESQDLSGKPEYERTLVHAGAALDSLLIADAK